MSYLTLAMGHGSVGCEASSKRKGAHSRAVYKLKYSPPFLTGDTLVQIGDSLNIETKAKKQKGLEGQIHFSFFFFLCVV